METWLVYLQMVRNSIYRGGEAKKTPLKAYFQRGFYLLSQQS